MFCCFSASMCAFALRASAPNIDGRDTRYLQTNVTLRALPVKPPVSRRTDRDHGYHVILRHALLAAFREQHRAVGVHEHHVWCHRPSSAG
jgi:hypothetical protein